MLLIFSHTSTNRLNYVLELIFERVLKTEYRLTTDVNEFINSASPKLSYSDLETEVFINPTPLLFEKNIKNLFPGSYENGKDFTHYFKTNKADFLGYDLFAAVFYFSTRYEEYLESKKDEHQRCRAEDSLAFQCGCLQKPFLNEAIRTFGDKLKEKFPALQFGKSEFRFLSTIDIDNAFAYAHKGLFRNSAGLIKDVFSFRFGDVIVRLKSNLNENYDPFNTYKLIQSISQETQTALQYFVLIGDYARLDKNPHFKNKGFRTLIKRLAEQNPVGLHPSYESFSNPEKISVEKSRLEEIIQEKVTSARCHFLRVNLPDTYRTFIDNGITNDYTMIYASQVGFRTGMCVPYPWFDLERDCKTELILHTSALMEGTLRDYNKLNPDDAASLSLELMNEVYKNRGNFISVFHNDSFARGQEEWISLYRGLLLNAREFSEKPIV